jgi:hypothetical protein
LEVARERRWRLPIPDTAVEASFRVSVDVQAFHDACQAHRFVDRQSSEASGIRDGEELQFGEHLGDTRFVDELELYQEAEVIVQQSQSRIIQQEVSVMRKKISRSA